MSIESHAVRDTDLESNAYNSDTRQMLRRIYSIIQRFPRCDICMPRLIFEILISSAQQKTQETNRGQLKVRIDTIVLL